MHGVLTLTSVIFLLQYNNEQQCFKNISDEGSLP